MGHVCISYSSKHRDLTERLAALLKSEGFAVWWDYDLESWGSYQTQIDEAWNAASVVVVIWSVGAAASDYVKAEASRAKNARKLVNARALDFPVTGIPTPFCGDHVDKLDFDEPHRLLRSIRSVWAGKPHATVKALHEHYEEAFGVCLFDTKRAATTDRVAGELGPSDLLQAKNEIVPFIDATGLGADMLAWCRDGARPVAGRLIHGPGGFGKTRLMIETARLLRAQNWLAGFLPPLRFAGDLQEQRQREQALEQAFAFGDEPGVLLIVDYAEGRQDEVAAIASLLARRGREATRPVKVVLLARGDQWWKAFMAQPNVAPVFRADGKPLGDVIALDTIPVGRPRLDFWVAAVTALEPAMAALAAAGTFPGWDGKPPHQDRLAALQTQAAFARPLALQMEALLYLASATPGANEPGVDTLLDSILVLEQAHWSKVLGPLGDGRKRDLTRAVAQVTAVQGVDGMAAVQRLLQADGFYAGARTSPVSVDDPLRDLARLYGRTNGGAAHLEPDLVGEHQVASIDRNGIELIDSCLAWIAGEPADQQPVRRRALLTVLQRATRPEHGAIAAGRAVALIDHLILNHGGTLGADMVKVMGDTPGALFERLGVHVETLPEDTLAAINFALPANNLILEWFNFALRVAQRYAALAQNSLIAADAAKLPPETQQSLQNRAAAAFGTLGIRYSNLKRLDDALTASEEAVKIYRALTAREPAVFGAVLATSLNNLGIRYAALKRLDDALIASEEAVKILRALYARDPAVFGADLAQSLSNLGIWYSNLKRLDDALTASEEAVKIYRALTARDPAVFGADLARSLNNLGNRYAALKRLDDALTASEEAVKIRRALTARDPAVFGADLARSLNNLGIRYAELKRLDDALTASEEAVKIRRALTAQRPFLFGPDLAQSLSVMSDALRALKRSADGAAATREGLQAILPSLQARPELFIDLAAMLAREHLEASQEAGQEPDMEVVGPIGEILQRLQGAA